MAEQGSYPLNGRAIAPTDTLTGVVTGQTADVPLSVLAAFLGGATSSSGTTLQRPAPIFIGQGYFDTTLGFPVWAKQLSPAVWVDAAGVSL